MATVIEDVTDFDPSENDEIFARVLNQVRQSRSSYGLARFALATIETVNYRVTNILPIPVVVPSTGARCADGGRRILLCYIDQLHAVRCGHLVIY